MTSPFLVIDASVAISWVSADENEPYSQSVLQSLPQYRPIAPAVWPLEVGNDLVMAERRQRLAWIKAGVFLSFFQVLPIVVEMEQNHRFLPELLELARQQQLSVYDASYLRLAMRLPGLLATMEKRLRQVAANAGVQLFGE
ncbi:MAG: type II toxin-antitoxin system VapC family toxin [Syntrophales bacterium]|nr:type II toxin-antitoxin system VapC family toxin [Syntrophales bacterium]